MMSSLNSVEISDSVTQSVDSVPMTETTFVEEKVVRAIIKEEGRESRTNNCLICYKKFQATILSDGLSKIKCLPVDILCKTVKIPTKIINDKASIEAIRQLYCFECLPKVEQAESILIEIENLERVLSEIGSFFKNQIIATYKHKRKKGDLDPIHQVRKSLVQCWKGWTVPISFSESSLAKQNDKRKAVNNVLNTTTTNQETEIFATEFCSVINWSPGIEDLDHPPLLPVSILDNNDEETQVSNYDDQQQENKPPPPPRSLRPTRRAALKRKGWKHSLSDSDDDGSENKTDKKIKIVTKFLSVDDDDDSQDHNTKDEDFVVVEKKVRKNGAQKNNNTTKVKLESSSKGRQFKCNHCRRTFSTQLARTGHVKKKHQGDSKPYECNKCNRKFDKPSKLFAHQKRWHPTQSNSESENTNNNSNLNNQAAENVGAFACPECRMMFKSNQTRQAHILRFHKGEKRPYRCDVCDKCYRHKVHLDDHMELHGAGNRFPCQGCDKEFVSERKLRVHMANVHCPGGDKPFQCEKCSRSFAKVYLLESHMYKHSGYGKRFICEICGHSYSSNKRLQVHLQRHANGVEIKEPFQCQQCEKVFSEPQSLSSHVMSIHEKKFRFHCEVCGQGCQMLSMLKRHMLCHTEDKMFSCEICVDKKFKRKPQLVQHMLIHENKFPYICKHCTKGFRASEKLKNHEKLHTGEKPFECTIVGCDKRFALKHYLTNHINTGHKGMKQQKRPKTTDGPARKGHSTQRVKPIKQGITNQEIQSIQEEERQVFLETQESLHATELTQNEEVGHEIIATEIEASGLTMSISNANSTLTHSVEQIVSNYNIDWTQFGFINHSTDQPNPPETRTEEAEQNTQVVSTESGFKVDNDFNT